ncbi:hypothetical protein J6590_087887 [Homalodisca vitripennis]|nr:hypothetical protein J6590_087887 [Homalodisca vitripennis]
MSSHDADSSCEKGASLTCSVTWRYIGLSADRVVSPQLDHLRTEHENKSLDLNA